MPPEDALSTEPTQHDYTGLMRLESPHEVKPNPDYKPGQPNTPRGVVEDQRERLNTGEAPVDGVSGVEPGGGGEITTAAASFDPDADPSADGAESPYDPSEHTVEDVLAYLGRADVIDNPITQAEHDRVIEAERAGKARKGILGD